MQLSQIIDWSTDLMSIDLGLWFLYKSFRFQDLPNAPLNNSYIILEHCQLFALASITHLNRPTVWYLHESSLINRHPITHSSHRTDVYDAPLALLLFSLSLLFYLEQTLLTKWIFMLDSLSFIFFVQISILPHHCFYFMVNLIHYHRTNYFHLIRSLINLHQITPIFCGL